MTIRGVMFKVLAEEFGDGIAADILRRNDLRSPFADMLNLPAPDNYEEKFRSQMHHALNCSETEIAEMERINTAQNIQHVRSN